MLFALLAWATGATADVYINATNFPSENFRQWVSDNCDLDHNGSLSNFELGQVTTVSLGIEQKPMYTLKGIEYFTDLMFLYCYECALTSLDVSNNPKLRNLDCSGNHLTTLDLSNNDLIVLSACSTGLGEVSLTGTSGIVRGLKKAGAHSAIVSLWEVNDAATRLLMTYFFDFLNQGMSKHEAFCAAREKLRNFDGKVTITVQEYSQTRMANVPVEKEFKPDFSNPYYWAPFVLIDGL